MISSLFIATAQPAVNVIPSLVDSLIQLSRAHTAETEFDLAFTASASAGETTLACCGKESAAYAAYCFNEGRIRYFMGRNKEAVPWYIQSRALRGQLLGTDDVEYGKSCNNLAIANDGMERYEEAEALYSEALAIREATAGKASATYNNALANLASMYQSMGEFAVAEKMTLEVLESRRQLLGENDLYYAQSLINLGSIGYETFNYEEARRLYTEAKQIIEQQEALDFYTYVKVLDNLVAVHENLGEFEQSKGYYQEAKNLNQEVLGKQTRDYTLNLTHLASVSLRAEQFDESEAYLQECLDILDQLELHKSVEYGLALLDQSKIHFIRGQDALALGTIQQTIDNFDHSLNPNNPQYLFSLWQQATYYQATNDYEAAEANLRRIARLESAPLASAVRYLSDQELANFTDTFRDYLSQSLALAKEHPLIADLCYNKLLLYKGFLLNNALEFRKQLQHDDQRVTTYQQLRGLHRRLSTMYTAKDIDASEIQAFEASAQTLEKKLVRSSRNATTLSTEVHWQDIQQVIREDEAALEFATYEIFSATGQPIAVHNAALLLLPGDVPPIYISLGTQDELNQLLQETGSTQERINALYRWEM